MRRPILLAITLAALMAATTTTAHAQSPGFEVIDGSTYLICDDVVVDGNDVSGGCLDEDWSFDFAGGDPEATWVPCNVRANIRFDSDGSLYVVDQQNGYVYMCEGAALKPCEDEQANETLPWTAELRDGEDPGVLEVDMQICYETWSGGTHYTPSVTFNVVVDGSDDTWFRRFEQIAPAPAIGNIFWGVWQNGGEYDEERAADDVIVYWG
jgi:hypothetical protein